MELETLLQDLGDKPLPGGVTAAAYAAAMGAALLIKVARVTLQRQDASSAVRDRFQVLRVAALTQQNILVDLADKDTLVYRSLLDLKRSKADAATLKSAWCQVLAVPLRVAETCHLLLQTMCGYDEICPAYLLPDLWIAQSLIESGLHAGIWAVEANLQVSPPTLDTAPFRFRLQGLSTAKRRGTPDNT